MSSTLSETKFEFNLKTKTRFGIGEALSLGQYLKELSIKRVGIVIDSAILDLDYSRQILDSIRNQDFLYVNVWAYDLKAEPDYESLDRIKMLFLNSSGEPAVDCFVGIGGGSVIDFAKGLATVTVNPGPAIRYRGFPKGIKPSLPTIALPTTAGTGSEVTYNAVFIEWNEKVKYGINTMNNFPALAILDPNLVKTCPQSVALSSGMDALVHTMESYMTNGANPMTQIFAREAFYLLFNNLPRIFEERDIIEYWARVQFGAYLAGISLFNAGAGPAGAFSYSLGVHFRVPHGIGGAVFLPPIVEHNAKRGYDFSELYDLIEGADRSLDKKTKSRLFVSEFHNLYKRLDLKCEITQFGVNASNIGILLKEVDDFTGAFEQNPVPFTIDDGKELLARMIRSG
jgi:alcohol dehydrogenase class IV